VAGGGWPVAGGRWPVAGGPVAGGRWPKKTIVICETYHLSRNVLRATLESEYFVNHSFNT